MAGQILSGLQIPALEVLELELLSVDALICSKYIARTARIGTLVGFPLTTRQRAT
jgi:hypothetical protein